MLEFCVQVILKKSDWAFKGLYVGKAQDPCESYWIYIILHLDHFTPPIWCGDYVKIFKANARKVQCDKRTSGLIHNVIERQRQSKRTLNHTRIFYMQRWSMEDINWAYTGKVRKTRRNWGFGYANSHDVIGGMIGGSRWSMHASIWPSAARLARSHIGDFA